MKIANLNLFSSQPKVAEKEYYSVFSAPVAGKVWSPSFIESKAKWQQVAYKTALLVPTIMILIVDVIAGNIIRAGLNVGKYFSKAEVIEEGKFSKAVNWIRDNKMASAGIVTTLAFAGTYGYFAYQAKSIKAPLTSAFNYIKNLMPKGNLAPKAEKN